MSSIEESKFLSEQLFKIAAEFRDASVSGEIIGAMEVLAGVALVLEKRAMEASDAKKQLEIELLLKNTTEKMVENMRKDLLQLEVENTRAAATLDRLGYEQDEFGEWLLCQHPKSGKHGDDETLALFVRIMAARLKYKREKENRSGWQLMADSALTTALNACIKDKRWVDAANYAMFLHMNTLRRVEYGTEPKRD